MSGCPHPANTCPMPSPTGKASKDCVNTLKYIKCIEKINECINIKNNEAKNSYDSRMKVYKSNQSTHANEVAANNINRDNYKTTLRNERKVWRNCVPHRDSTGGHSDWCRSEFGNGWEHISSNNDGCFTGCNCSLGFSKGVCSRTFDEASRLAAERYPDIQFTDVPPGANVNFTTIPLTGLSCCDNTINIVNSDIKNTEYTQKCALGQEKDVVSTGKLDTQGNGQGTSHGTEESEIEPENNNNLYISGGIGSFISLLIACFISSSILIIMFME